MGPYSTRCPFVGIKLPFLLKLSTKSINFSTEYFSPFQIVLGKVVGRETVIDQALASSLIKHGKGLPFKVMAGKTVCTHDFYEGQARWVNVEFGGGLFVCSSTFLSCCSLPSLVT